MRVPREIPIAGLGPERKRNQDARLQQAGVLGSLEVNTPAALMREVESSYNRKNLSAGTHPPLRIRKPFSMVCGIGVKTIMDVQSTVDNKSVIDGIHFRNSPSSTEELVIVGTSSDNSLVRVVFRNCVFERTSRMASPAWVRVSPAARAVFVGCLFSGGQGSGQLIDNQAPNPITNVHLIGCVNADPVVGLGNVTATGVIS